jgi:regulator of sigma E protease
VDLISHTILPFAGVLIALIVVHELGHFMTAKLTGVKVLEAGLGYPPRAWGFTWRGTLYSLNWLPLGGFVRLLGEEDPSDPQSLAAKPRWVRLIVLASGSGMNFLLPVILFAIVFMIPRDVATGPAIIDLVEQGSPAAEAGLQSGDKIVELDGKSIKNVREASRAIYLNLGDTVDFTVQRPIFGGGSEELTIPVHARWTYPEGQGPTGIRIGNLSPFTEKESFPLWEAVPKGTSEYLDTLILFRNEVFTWFKSGSGPELAGPVGIAQATGEVVEQSGWEALLELAALLSFNLAIINILPLPMLDGGRIVFVLLEIVRGGRRIAPEKEALVHLVGLALIITLAIVITVIDVNRIIGGESLFR